MMCIFVVTENLHWRNCWGLPIFFLEKGRKFVRSSMIVLFFIEQEETEIEFRSLYFLNFLKLFELEKYRNLILVPFNFIKK
jgi:hypothetical protein